MIPSALFDKYPGTLDNRIPSALKDFVLDVHTFTRVRLLGIFFRVVAQAEIDKELAYLKKEHNMRDGIYPASTLLVLAARPVPAATRAQTLIYGQCLAITLTEHQRVKQTLTGFHYQANQVVRELCQLFCFQE